MQSAWALYDFSRPSRENDGANRNRICGFTDIVDSTHSLDHFLQQIERRALGMATLATGNREEGLDIVQDAMMKFAVKYANKPADEWAPLFYRVLQNQTRDWQRRTRVRNRWRVWLGSSPQGQQVEQDPVQSVCDPSAIDPLKELAQTVAMDELQKALTELPTRQRQAFLLRMWEGLDVAQTAKAMQVSEGSVKTHYSRAVHSLRKNLQGHWP